MKPKKPPRISFALLCTLHRKLVKTAKKKGDIGHFRKRQNWIGPENEGIEKAHYLPPKASQIPRHMKNLSHYLHSKEKDPLVQTAIWMAQFLSIHPFMNGNGRVARAMIPIILCYKKLLPAPHFNVEPYFKKYRQAYFEKLFAITQNQEWEEWIRFFLKGIIYTGKRVQRRTRK